MTTNGKCSLSSSPFLLYLQEMGYNFLHKETDFIESSSFKSFGIRTQYKQKFFKTYTIFLAPNVRF